jgi:hypothetical protein
MTGDFIIRIAEGVTVERGDLLMSAGDGTAKPQDDDIIRSKTIAKVTSINGELHLRRWQLLRPLRTDGLLSSPLHYCGGQPAFSTGCNTSTLFPSPIDSWLNLLLLNPQPSSHGVWPKWSASSLTVLSLLFITRSTPTTAPIHLVHTAASALKAPEGNVIPYADLTPEIVVGWVQESKLGGDEKVAEIQAALQAQIDQQRTPTTGDGVPWS